MTTPTFQYLEVLNKFIIQYDLHEERSKTLEVSKKDTVLKLKDLLVKEAEFEKKPIDIEKISAKIVNDLKGRVSGTYVRELLGPEFKDQSKVREQKPVRPIMVAATGETAPAPAVTEEHSTPSPPRGETREEKRKREFEEWQRAKYAKVATKASNKMQHAERKEQQTAVGTKTYTGPSIGEPKQQQAREEMIEEEETSYFITITDTDIIDEIVLLRTQQNVMRIRLEVDATERTVMGIRQKP